MAARYSLIAALLCAAMVGPLRAQEYQRLHVRGFVLSSSTAQPQLDVPFAVTISIHVAENVGVLENVYLPSFVGPEELGDVRQYHHGAGGTVYTETMTLIAHARGPLTIGSAYLDAIDARDGVAKRFISNPLHLQVGGGPLLDVWRPLRALAMLLFELVLLAAGIFVVFALFVRKRALLRHPPDDREARRNGAPAVQGEVVLGPSKDDLDEAFTHLRHQRTRAAVFALRAALWRQVGAHLGETLGDVLLHPGAADAQTRRCLMAVERAAFVEDPRLGEAIDEVLALRGSFP